MPLLRPVLIVPASIAAAICSRPCNCVDVVACLLLPPPRHAIHLPRLKTRLFFDCCCSISPIYINPIPARRPANTPLRGSVPTPSHPAFRGAASSADTQGKVPCWQLSGRAGSAAASNTSPPVLNALLGRLYRPHLRVSAVLSSKQEWTATGIWPGMYHVMRLSQSAFQPPATPPRPPYRRHSKQPPPAG